MTGYLTAMGDCFACGRFFAFSPSRVPSIRDAAGERQPVCEPCMARANALRRANGLPPHEILPGAYDADTEGDAEGDTGAEW
jgi:hypothetical protein